MSERALTDLEITDARGDDNFGSTHQIDYSAASGRVEVLFRRQSERLIEMIDQTANLGGHILGAVAWLTDKPILEALSRVSAAIVVQKEDFLRPDSHVRGKADLRRQYEAIEFKGERYSLPA